MTSINHVESFRQRIQAGKICVGTEINVTDPIATEVAAEAGCDFVWIEMEHTHLDLPAVMGHILAARAAQTPALVRVRWNDPVLIKPVIDMAPAGIIVPMIRTEEDAALAVKACRYPPEGIRGFGPLRNMYGQNSMAAYLESAAEQVMTIVQIETTDAVRNLDAILATPGLDGIVLGRNDLSGSLGKLGQHSDPEVLRTIDLVLEKASATNLYVGTSIGFNAETFKEWSQKGVQWFTFDSALEYVAAGVESIIKATR